MKGKGTAVIYDFDGTIAGTEHRWHLSPMSDKNSSWEIYSGACLDDVPLLGTIARMRLDWHYHQVHICSGRSNSSRANSVAWLDKHAQSTYDYLQLRPEDDRRSNAQLKIDYINLIRQDVEVVLFYEDYPKVGRLIQAETGVPVLGVNPFYEADDHKREGAPVLVKGSDALGGGL